MADLNALLARVKKLETTKSGSFVFLILRDGRRFKTTSKKMLGAMQASAGDAEVDPMMMAKRCSDGSRLYELFQAVMQ